MASSFAGSPGRSVSEYNVEENSRLEKCGVVERLDHGVHHVGGAVILALFQQFPHLAQIGAQRRLQRGIAFDQGSRDAESDALSTHSGLLNGGFAHGWLLRMRSNV